MSTPLRVLFVEDSEDDVWMLRRELERAGYAVSFARVDTAPALQAALGSAQWDAVISDYGMPNFSMPDALRLVQASSLDLPFIIVSGTVGEESVVAALKAGADDFMAKDKLARFVPGLERAIRDAAARRERRQRERELEAIASLSQALRTAASRAEMLPVILDQSLALLRSDSGYLALVDAATGGHVVALARGQALPFAGERLPPGEGIAGHVITTGQPYVTTDIHTDGLLPTGERFAAMPHTGIVCVPLIAHEQTLGALAVLRPDPTPPDEVRLLSAVADIAASALHRATLFEQTEQRLERLTALRAIDLAINASLDSGVILDVLLSQVVTQLHVDAADVLLTNPLGQYLTPAAGRGFRTTGWQNSEVRLGEGLAGRAALERRMVALPDLRTAHVPPQTAEFLAREGFQAYFAAPLIAKGQVNGVLEVYHRAPINADHEWVEFLDTLAGQAAIAVNNTGLFEGLQRSNAELARAYEATIEGWSRALDLRDKETEGHTRRVTEVTLRLAQALGVAASELTHMRRGALLHDIGKMAIPDQILLKPGPLDDAEWEIMRRHPLYAYELLSPIDYLRPALDIPLYHHEKWDGSGYPHGLSGAQIPLSARIFAVADVWDALRSDRPYRAGWPADRVRAYILEQAGRHFEPAIVQTFMTLDLEAIGAGAHA